jgi:hypothetical protein
MHASPFNVHHHTDNTLIPKVYKVNSIVCINPLNYSYVSPVVVQSPVVVSIVRIREEHGIANGGVASPLK